MIFNIYIIFINFSLSFLLNIMIDRLPAMIFQGRHMIESIFSKHSPCQICLTKFHLFTYAPVFSFFKKNSCDQCHKGNPFIFLATTLYTIITPLIIIHALHYKIIICAYIILFNGLWVIACIDAKHLIIPDCINYFLLWLGVLIQSHTHPNHLQSVILGVVITYISIQSVHALYFAVRKKIGIGGGDVKMLSMLSVWMGYTAIPLVVFLSCISAIAYILFQKYFRGKNKQHTAFGPHIAFVSALIIVLAQFVHSPFIKTMLQFSL